MHAMVLKKLRLPLEWTELPDRQPGPHEIRVKVLACGVCRTDLHVVDGELPDPKLRSSQGTRSLDALMLWVLQLKICRSANGLASPGWGTRMEPVLIA